MFTISLKANTPLVVSGQNAGSSNFIVDLHPHSGGIPENLFNEIGPYHGQTAWADAQHGSYRVSVQAEGIWHLVFTQPSPPSNAQIVPGTVSGAGAKVIPIRTASDLSPTVTGRNGGTSNFIVDLIGYGAAVSGEQNIFNEIGPWSGQTVIDSMPRGDYLLWVAAEGPWRIKFQG